MPQNIVASLHPLHAKAQSLEAPNRPFDSQVAQAPATRHEIVS